MAVGPGGFIMIFRPSAIRVALAHPVWSHSIQHHPPLQPPGQLTNLRRVQHRVL
jgi:hypothetical protein